MVFPPLNRLLCRGFLQLVAVFLQLVATVKGNNLCSNTYNFLGLFAMLFHRHPSQLGN